MPTGLTAIWNRTPTYSAGSAARLEDVFLSYDAQMDEKAQEVTGFQIKEHSVIFSGICPQCAAKEKTA